MHGTWRCDDSLFEMESDFVALVERAIAGDLSALDRLAGAPWSDIVASVEDRSFELASEAVVGVARRLQRGEFTGGDAQRWASFVRRGFIAGVTLGFPVTPLVIDYEAAHEDAIVEVVARLDEIGDVIDGEVPDDEEIASLLAPLTP
jgi:hypothetical protein